MVKSLVSGLLLLSLIVISVSANDDGVSRCNCDDDGALWSIESILGYQRVSDFLIAVAYFSIPIELLYFVTCSNLPFKWVLFEFIAFIVLCGLTHLLSGWTYGPHSFHLMLSVTVFKILTALVSCATAITLFTLIPLLLKVKIREFMLRKKAWDLGREVGLIMKQREAGLHVRMLTQEIRKSLDRHTILYTTLVELSKTLGLQNCAVWMPNEIRTVMNLTHELNGDNDECSIPISDPDVVRIKGSEGVNILSPNSALAIGSIRDPGEPGPIAAIRMPMLRVCDFKGGTPEMIQACYAILVLVLPGGEPRSWTYQELEIIKVVADQVAVAISHATILEESQLMREKLEEQNRALQQAKQNVLMASQARAAFQKVMSDGMKRPMHSILGLISMMQDGSLRTEQQILVNSMMKTSNVLSTLINDVMEISPNENGRFPLELRSFGLHSTVREAACLAKCLCAYRGFGISIEVDKTLPDNVWGDERRVFQVILHMFGSLIDGNNRRKVHLVFRVFMGNGSREMNDHKWVAWRTSSNDNDVCIRFEITMKSDGPSSSDGSSSSIQFGGTRYASDGIEEALSFSVCQKLVQLMNGKIWVVPNADGTPQTMGLILHFQLHTSISKPKPESAEFPEHGHSNSLLRGLQVLLADPDDFNGALTRKQLEKLGCIVANVSSGYECLGALGQATNSFQIVLLDLEMPEPDGYEVASRIRKFRSRNWPLIVGLTEIVDQNVWERCVEIGINGVIQKPIMLQGIESELRRVVLQANKDYSR